MRMILLLLLLATVACSEADEPLRPTLSPRSPNARIYTENAWGMSGNGRMLQKIKGDPSVRVVLNSLLFDRDGNRVGHFRLIWIGNDGEADLYRVAVADGIQEFAVDQVVRYRGGKMVLIETDTQRIYLDDTEALNHRPQLTGDARPRKMENSVAGWKSASGSPGSAGGWQLSLLR